jgi:hypothetical protein
LRWSWLVHWLLPIESRTEHWLVGFSR